jgi:hypothetical protein
MRNFRLITSVKNCGVVVHWYGEITTRLLEHVLHSSHQAATPDAYYYFDTYSDPKLLRTTTPTPTNAS